MVHAMPFIGWIDHGFYSFHPTFYWDLAAQNNYRVALMLNAELDPLRLTIIETREDALKMAESGKFERPSLLYTFFEKSATDAPFVAPMQGYYAGTLSNAATASWQTLRF